MVNCKKCQEDFPAQRWELGYRICVTCSTEEKWSAVPIINHKTGNEIQVVKDPEVAAEFLAKSARVGFGTMRGMSSSYKRKLTSMETPVAALPDKPLLSREISRRPLPNEFDKVGEEVMLLIENGLVSDAYACVKESRNAKRIYKVHEEQLTEIINELTKNLNN